MLADQPEDRRAFNLIKKDETQLFTFRDKEVTAIFNVLMNYVGSLIEQQMPSQLASAALIISPSPFVNCTYNECHLFYSGNVTLSNR